MSASGSSYHIYGKHSMLKSSLLLLIFTNNQRVPGPLVHVTDHKSYL